MNFLRGFRILVILFKLRLALAIGSPREVRIQNVTYDGFSVDFLSDEDAVSHQLQISSVLYSANSKTINASGIPVEVTGLSGNVRYSVKVRSLSADELPSNYSDAIIIRTNPAGASVIVSQPLKTMFTVFVEPVSGATEWAISVTNDSSSVATIEHQTQPFKIFRNMAPDTNYTVRARIGTVGEKNFTAAQSPFGATVIVKTAQLSKYGRLILLNVNYTESLEDTSSAGFRTLKEEWEPILLAEYRGKDSRVTGVAVLDFDESSPGVICHHEIFMSGRTSVDNSVLLLEDSESIAACLITDDVNPENQYALYLESGRKAIALEQSDCPDAADQRYFRLTRGGAVLSSTMVSLRKYRNEAGVKLINTFQFHGNELLDPGHGALTTLAPNSIYSVDQLYLLKDCLKSGDGSLMYSRRNGAYSRYTIPGYHDTFIYSTGPSPVDVTDITYAASADRNEITLRIPSVYRAVKYSASLRDDHGVELNNLDNSPYVEASLTGFNSDEIHCIWISVTIQHPNGSHEDSAKSCFEFLAGSPDETNIRIAEVNSTQFTVQYPLIRFATRYIIEVSNATYSRNYTTADSRFTVTEDVTEGEVYVVRVATQNPFGTGRFSNTEYTKFWSFHNITNSSMSLTWENVTADKQYALTIMPTGTSYLLNSSTCDLRSLDAGVTYRVTVVLVQSTAGSGLTLFTDQQITAPEHPNNVRQIGEAAHNITIKADHVLSATLYTASISNSSEDVIQTLSSTVPEFTFEEMQAGTAFRLHIYARNDGGRSAISIETVYTVPESVTDLMLSAGSRTVFANWSDSEGASSYSANLRKDAGSVAHTRNVNVPVVIFDNLEAGTPYAFEVYAIASTGSSTGVNKSVITEKETPRDIATENVTETSFSLSWSDIPGAIQYLVYCERTETGTISNKTTTSPTTLQSGLLPGTVYECTISAIYPAGMSDLSEPHRQVTVPSKILPELAAGGFSIEVRISSVKGADAYVLVLGNSTVVVTDLLYTFSNLDAGTSYTVSVASRNVAGTGEYTERSVDTDVLIPEDVKTSAVTNQSFVVEWEEIKGATSYNVSIVSAAGAFFLVTSGSPVTAAGLSSGTNYSVTVSAQYNVGKSSSSRPVYQFTVPLSPTSINVYQTTQSWVSIGWISVFGAEFYDVNISGIFYERTEKTSINITNLSPGSTYLLQLVAGNVGGVSTPQFTDIATLPAKPLLRFTNVTPDSVVVSWNASSGSTRYNVTVTGPNGEILTGFGITVDTSVKIDGIGIDGVFEVDVAAIAPGGISSESASVKFVSVPKAPMDVNLTSRTTRSLSFTWKALDGIHSYDIEHDGNESRTSDNAFTLSGLLQDTMYTFAIRSVNIFGVKSNATVVSFQTLRLPLSPAFVISNVTDTSATVSWRSPKGADKFSIRLTAVKNETFNVFLILTNKTILTNLTSATQYEVTVASMVGDDHSQNPQNRTFTTLCSRPGHFTISSMTQDAVSVSWQQVPGATGYELNAATSQDTVRGKRSSGPFFRIPPNRTSASILLEAATSYELSLVAINSAGSSDPAVLSIKTGANNPDELNIIEVTTDSFVVAWDSPVGAYQYRFHIRDQENTHTSRIVNDTKSQELDLKPGHPYYIYVTTFSQIQPGGMYENLLRPPHREIVTVTNPPKNASAVEVKQSLFTVSWMMPYGAFLYFVFLSSPNLNITYNTTETAFNVSCSVAYGEECVVEVAAENGQGRLSRRSEPVILRAKKDTDETEKSSKENLPWWAILLAIVVVALIVVILVVWKVKKTREQNQRKKQSGFYDFELARQGAATRGTDEGEVATDEVQITSPPNDNQPGQKNEAFEPDAATDVQETRDKLVLIPNNNSASEGFGVHGEPGDTKEPADPADTVEEAPYATVQKDREKIKQDATDC